MITMTINHSNHHHLHLNQQKKNEIDPIQMILYRHIPLNLDQDLVLNQDNTENPVATDHPIITKKGKHHHLYLALVLRIRPNPDPDLVQHLHHHQSHHQVTKPIDQTLVNETEIETKRKIYRSSSSSSNKPTSNQSTISRNYRSTKHYESHPSHNYGNQPKHHQRHRLILILHHHLNQTQIHHHLHLGKTLKWNNVEQEIAKERKGKKEKEREKRKGKREKEVAIETEIEENEKKGSG